MSHRRNPAEMRWVLLPKGGPLVPPSKALLLTTFYVKATDAIAAVKLHTGLVGRPFEVADLFFEELQDFMGHELTADQQVLGPCV